MIQPEKISLLERTHRLVREFAQSVPDSLRTLKPDAVAFSINEIVHHLADVERLWHSRFEKMNEPGKTTFEAMNPDAVAADNSYNTKPMTTALDDWQSLREQTLATVKNMSEEHSSKVALHPRYGDMDVSRALDVMANHDLQHLEQMKRTLDIVSKK